MENHYNCIYMYTNKINGKRYVGQTNDFNRRHKEHIYAMTNKNDIEYNAPIQRAFRKYGLDNFDIEILKENLNTQCLLNFYECYYIKKFDLLCKNGKGYNVASGGSNGNVFAGKTEEEKNEIRRKQSEANKGKIFSDEHKQKLSETHKGKLVGENHHMYGKHLSEETKQKISKTRIKKGSSKGKNNPMYDKRHSKETKQKISEANTGKHHSEETKQKMSETRKGKNNPRAKKVAQCDKQGNLIKIWDYVKQIEEELGINHSDICACCRGKRKTAGGYIWRYAEETE